MVEPGRPAPTRPARVVSLLVALTLAVLGPVSLAPPASAHAGVEASWPANGQVLRVAPDHVLVEFTTEVSPDSVVAIVDPQGTSVTVGEPTVHGRFLSQRIRPTGETGTYVAGIHVIAQDQHPIVTRLEFSVDPAAVATTNPAGAEPTREPIRTAAAAAAPADATASGDHLKTVFPGVMLLILAGLAALTHRRQSRADLV